MTSSSELSAESGSFEVEQSAIKIPPHGGEVYVDCLWIHQLLVPLHCDWAKYIDG